MTCDNYLTGLENSLAQQTPTVTEWTPSSCDQYWSEPSSNYYYMHTFMTPCCISGLTACDVAKAVPQMCQEGDSDEKPGSTILTFGSSTSTCGQMKEDFLITYMSASSYPVTSWSTDECSASDQYGSYPVSSAMSYYAGYCCDSYLSACDPEPATIPAICSGGETDYKDGKMNSFLASRLKNKANSERQKHTRWDQRHVGA